MRDNPPACPNRQRCWEYPCSHIECHQNARSKNHAVIAVDAYQAILPIMDGTPTKGVLFSSENWGQPGDLLFARMRRRQALCFSPGPAAGLPDQPVQRLLASHCWRGADERAHVILIEAKTTFRHGNISCYVHFERESAFHT